MRGKAEAPKMILHAGFGGGSRPAAPAPPAISPRRRRAAAAIGTAAAAAALPAASRAAAARGGGGGGGGQALLAKLWPGVCALEMVRRISFSCPQLARGPEERQSAASARDSDSDSDSTLPPPPGGSRAARLLLLCPKGQHARARTQLGVWLSCGFKVLDGLCVTGSALD
ncbi:hypothetical protein Rsub_02708 [Raphidocelis subcapitata]|uniref:Uncharacterized protein n=1 Tax=Raphidocelis subcapitata TaxID=307507 RepID=A0A2V0NTK4_9CHLO|nr:hypothetical protein Rsub_02708 [Raphidocelis subcapitata]|eukprot:GBF90002.1 hypothetical protein Rsub_02708 [Raphidocelis subcapitata]